MSDNEIPPPLIPRPGKKQPQMELAIPWRLADSPRLQLEYLVNTEALSERDKKAVRSWLDKYNSFISRWIFANYGSEGLRHANNISRDTARRMTENQAAARENMERELFRKLEEDLKGE